MTITVTSMPSPYPGMAPVSDVAIFWSGAVACSDQFVTSG